MRFRPCIDIHNGKVKQIVGRSLKDEGNQASTNFTSELDAAWYARQYQKDHLKGGHIILLNPVGSEYYEATKKQVKYLMDNDMNELVESFYKDLEFGTGGLRGIMGVGTNRMNVYNVRRATQGLAQFIGKVEGGAQRGVAIAYDSRKFSKEFAQEAALVLCANGVKAYLYESLRPVPVLSFTV